jgi:phosphoglucosamine mutase
METRLIFGTDGIRGKVSPDAISELGAYELGSAVGSLILEKNSNPKVVLGRDTRESGKMLSTAMANGLCQVGVNVIEAGILPSPAVAYMTKLLKANIGIVISASHNIYTDNGFKFFDSDGTKISQDTENKIEQRLSNNFLKNSVKQGSVKVYNDAHVEYVNFCESCFSEGLLMDGLKVVLDAANGASYHCLGRVFSELGADIVEIGNKPNGRNINDQVGSLFPEQLSKKILETSSDIGIALDGDGDRVLVADSKGKVYQGDELIYAIAKSRIREHGLEYVKGVVGTLMSNLALEKIIIKSGLEFCRTKVGDRFIFQKLQERGWSLGGETSGHILLTDIHTTGDGIITALKIVEAMIESGKTIDSLIEGLELFPQVMVNVAIQSGCSWPASGKFERARAEVIDKLGKDGRILVRPSGTEPIIRIMVESKDRVLSTESANYLASFF